MSLNTTLFHDDEHMFYEKLERYTTPLRHCAQDMVDFIEHLEHQTQAIQTLKEVYFKLQRMPIKELSHLLEEIKSDLVNIEFQPNKSALEPKNVADFHDFYEIQNHFNAEVNALVKKAIEIEKLL